MLGLLSLVLTYAALLVCYDISKLYAVQSIVEWHEAVSSRFFYDIVLFRRTEIDVLYENQEDSLGRRCAKLLPFVFRFLTRERKAKLRLSVASGAFAPMRQHVIHAVVLTCYSLEDRMMPVQASEYLREHVSSIPSCYRDAF